MTVTTNEHGQQNMWAVEPQMVVEDYNKKGLLSPWQQKEMYNGRWAMMGLIMGFVTYAVNGKFFFGIFWGLTMTALFFTMLSVVFFVTLAKSIEKLCETY